MTQGDKFFGSHDLQSREERVKQSSDRSFGLVFAAVFALVGAVSWYYGGRHWLWWLGGSVAFGFIALMIPRVLAPLNAVWTKLGLLLFKVISPVVLALVFYVTVVPMGLLLRLLGKDLLNLKWQQEIDSYWIVRTPPGPEPDSLRNQF